MTDSKHVLACDATAPLHGRRWLAECLRASLGEHDGSGELVDDAVLCVSELLTNAIRARCTNLTLRLVVEDAFVRISVIDDAPGRPVAAAADPLVASGRGLRLVGAVSRRWGVDPLACGKEVWADFGRSG